MQKNRRLFIILLILVCLFAGASLLLHLGVFSALGAEDSTQNKETVLLRIPTDAVAEVEWSGGEAPAFRLTKNSQGEWVSAAQPEISLDQAKLINTVTALCQVVSTREIAAPADPQTYGLAPAKRKVTLTLSDGRSVTYFLGDLNPYTNRYYFQMEQDSTVHAVGYSVGESMNLGLLDYVKLPELPGLKLSFLDSITLQVGQQAFRAVHPPQGNDSSYGGTVAAAEHKLASLSW